MDWLTAGVWLWHSKLMENTDGLNKRRKFKPIKKEAVVKGKPLIRVRDFKGLRHGNPDGITAISVTLQMSLEQWHAIESLASLEVCSVTQLLNDAIATAVSRLRKRHAMIQKEKDCDAEQETLEQAGAYGAQRYTESRPQI